MAERMIEVQVTDSFRVQIREQGFPAAAELVAATIAATIRQGLPTPEADGSYWFKRIAVRHRQSVEVRRVWLGGRLVDGVLVLGEVWTEEADG